MQLEIVDNSPASDHTSLTNQSNHTMVCQTGFPFSKKFYSWMSLTIPQSHRPVFFKPGQPGLWGCGVVTDVRVENVFEKKNKKTSLWDCGTVTGRPGQKPDWKKMTRSVRQWYGHWRVKAKLICIVYDLVQCSGWLWIHKINIAERWNPNNKRVNIF